MESEQKQSIECSFYIKDLVLYFTYLDEQCRLCTITHGYNYLVYYSFEEQNKIIIQIKNQNDFYPSTFDFKNSFSKNVKLYIGKYNNKIFEGYLQIRIALEIRP